MYLNNHETTYVMGAPSNELKATAEAPKADLQTTVIEWGKLLKDLRIVNMGFASIDSPVQTLGFDEMPIEYKAIIIVHLDSTVAQVLGEDNLGNILTAEFHENNKAHISDVEFLGKSCELHGTWEEVTRKLFEMEKLMLSQIPEVPDDLKKL